MRFPLYVLLTLAGWLGFTHAAWAFTSPTAAFTAVRAPHALALDPSLSDPAWQAGLLPDGSGFADLTTRGRAPHGTNVYLLYDDTNLYIGFKMEQQGAPVIASQATNDVGFGSDDFVGAGLDTSGAGTQVYFFEVTPHGVRYEQAQENVRYRPQWQAAATATPTGWNAVMIVPLKDLRVQSTTWRFNFIRSVASAGEHYTWSYDGIMQDGSTASGWPLFTDSRFWPRLSGLHVKGAVAASRPKPRADIYALSSSGGDRTEFVQANGAVVSQNPRIGGLDFSIPLAATINFVGTVSPDFSNVEIDQQTIAPQEFQRALVEYRPFFAQGATFINSNAAPVGGILNAPNLVFYSPGINQVYYGGKVEGTFGDQSFGVLHFRGFDPTTGNDYDDTAFGYKHALPDRTFLYWADGVFANHSISGKDDTFEGGVAGRNLHTGLVWALDDSVESGSFVPYGFARSTNGFIDFHKPNWETLFGYVDITPNYGPIDGFTTNSDIRGFTGYLNLVGATPGVKNYGLFVAGDRYLDQSGAVHQADSGVFLTAVFKGGWALNGAGPQVGMLRSYGIPSGPGCSGPIVSTTYYTGFPCYRDGNTQPFNLFFVPIGYRDGSPRPTDGSYDWGNFGGNWVHQFTLTHSLPVGRFISLGLEYDGTWERSIATGVLESQWLRRVSLGINLGPDENATIALRNINGVGGFAPQQGLNFAAGFHKRFRNGNELFVNYGTPAAYTTLNRLIVKYVFHYGADAGT